MQIEDRIHGSGEDKPANVDGSEKRTAVEIAVIVPWDKIRNVLCSAFEGGSNYWYRITGYVEPKAGATPWPGEQESFPHIDYPVRDGGAVEIEDMLKEGGESTVRPVNRETITEGLRVMAAKYTRHFLDLCDDSSDATTGDVLLQCVAFGDVIYG